MENLLIALLAAYALAGCVVMKLALTDSAGWNKTSARMSLVVMVVVVVAVLQ
jgi:hypothetical protein